MTDFFYFVHSRLFISHTIFSNKFEFSNNYKDIIDINKKTLFHFVNIPIDNKYQLYKYKIEKHIIYIKYKPYCVLRYIIGINYNILYNILKNGYSIPSKKRLYSLIKRNNQYYNKKLYQCNTFKPNSIINYSNELVNHLIHVENTKYTDNIVKSNIYQYKNIYIDLVKEKCYLTNEHTNTQIELNGAIFNIDDNYIKYNSILRLVKYNYNTTNTKGTLIISNLIDEWKMFISKNFNKSTKIIFISSNKHFEKYTYNDIINASIVYISYNVLNSILTDYKVINLDNTIRNIQLDYNTINKTDYCNRYLCFIIYWNRLIIDNYQNINNIPKLYSIIKHIKSYNRWVLTNYNELTNSIISNMSKYLINKDHNILYSINFQNRVITFSLKNLNHLIKNKLVQETILIKKNNKVNVKKLYLHINDITSYLDYSCDYPNTINIDEPKECLICLNTISKSNIGVVRCGHIFCYNCCNNVRKCPICRKTLSNTDIVNVHQNKINIINDIKDNYDSKLEHFHLNNKKTSKIVIISMIYDNVDTLTNLLKYLDFTITNNLKKTLVNSDNCNIMCIYYHNLFYITNWDIIDKIIIWDIPKNTIDYHDVITYINQQIISIKKIIKLENYKYILD